MKTGIDWLTFRTKSNKFKILETIRPLFGTAADMLSLQTGLKGRDGWVDRADLVIADIRLGSIESGGDSQRDWLRVMLTGEGCGWVQCWDKVELIKAYLEEPEIRRLDIQLTTYERQVTYQSVLDAYERGEFKGVRGGVSPNLQKWENGDPRKGNTAYIGERTSDKFLRCYEKGKESLKHLGASQRAVVTTYEGYPIEDVFRVELELKAKAQYIPWEAISHRDEVFAASYPFCASLLPKMPEFRLQTLPDFKPKAAITAALENCRHSYGQTLRTALDYFGGDRDRLLDSILANQPSDRLIEAGVMTV